LLRSGQRIKSRLVDVRRVETSVGYPRIALLVPKFDQTVVRRNRLKRRLRELARLHLLTHPSSWDLLVRARREAYEAPFARLREEIASVAAQLTP
jgi:ribonuclease P protein component